MERTLWRDHDSYTGTIRMNRDELGGRAGYDETFCLDEEENKESQSRRDVGRGLSSHRASSSLAMPWFVAKTERTTGC